MTLSLEGATYGGEQTLLELYGNRVAYGLIGIPGFTNLRYINEVFQKFNKFTYRHFTKVVP